MSKSGSNMDGKRPRQVPPPCATTKDPMWQIETPAEMSQHQTEEKITVAINANLLQCSVCSGPLTPPLFQCKKGHVSCSACSTQGSVDDEVECLMCHEPKVVNCCHALEQFLAGLNVPCLFRQHGCVEMVPYTSQQAHKESCAHAPLHCPISGCMGYASKPLREHVQHDHPGMVRTVVSPGILTPLRMRAHEQARVVRLGDSDGNEDGGAEFLFVVGQYKELGRALSMVRLVDEYADKQDFKYRIQVVGKAGMLQLSGEPVDAKRLAESYEATPFLFVPNKIWDSPEDYFRVFIELK